MSLEITFTDNSDEILQALAAKMPVVLEACGIAMESYTKANIAAAGRVDKHGYIDSITHTVKGEEVYVGSNLNYAIYNELGTGSYASDGKGRRGWWVYVAGQDEKTAAAHRNTEGLKKIYTKGQAAFIVARLRKKNLDAHMTQGMKPIHALQKAASEHDSEYKAIIENVLKG